MGSLLPEISLDAAAAVIDAVNQNALSRVIEFEQNRGAAPESNGP
jgi:hypothetical protein